MPPSESLGFSACFTPFSSWHTAPRSPRPPAAHLPLAHRPAPGSPAPAPPVPPRRTADDTQRRSSLRGRTSEANRCRPLPGPARSPAPGAAPGRAAPAGRQKARWNEKINVNLNNKGHRAARAPADFWLALGFVLSCCRYLA